MQSCGIVVGLRLKKMKLYSELIKIPTFEERFKYLKLNGKAGDPTFDAHRYLNQSFYQSYEWQNVRRKAILRDFGCDLAMNDRPINKYIIVHHINPITIDDILNHSNAVVDLENLICVSRRTHNAIHFSDESILYQNDLERRPYDTCPWR